MLVGKDHMLLGKDHAGGEESCVGGISSWRQRILWVVEDVDYCKFVILPQKISFFAQNGSPCVRSQHELQQTV